jgi:hypothetical protein
MLKLLIPFLSSLSIKTQSLLRKTCQQPRMIPTMGTSTTRIPLLPVAGTRNQTTQNRPDSTTKVFTMTTAVYSNTAPRTASALYATAKSINFPRWKHHRNMRRPLKTRLKNVPRKEPKRRPRKTSKQGNKDYNSFVL